MAGESIIWMGVCTFSLIAPLFYFVIIDDMVNYNYKQKHNWKFEFAILIFVCICSVIFSYIKVSLIEERHHNMMYNKGERTEPYGYCDGQYQRYRIYLKAVKETEKAQLPAEEKRGK